MIYQKSGVRSESAERIAAHAPDATSGVHSNAPSDDSPQSAAEGMEGRAGSRQEDAATTIQAGFRGHQVRKQMKQEAEAVEKKSPKRTGSLEDKSATKIQAGVRGYLARKKHSQQKEAATKIQASFRGFKARKDIKKTTTEI